MIELVIVPEARLDVPEAEVLDQPDDVANRIVVVDQRLPRDIVRPVGGPVRVFAVWVLAVEAPVPVSVGIDLVVDV